MDSQQMFVCLLFVSPLFIRTQWMSEWVNEWVSACHAVAVCECDCVCQELSYARISCHIWNIIYYVIKYYRISHNGTNGHTVRSLHWPLKSTILLGTQLFILLLLLLLLFLLLLLLLLLWHVFGLLLSVRLACSLVVPVCHL